MLYSSLLPIVMLWIGVLAEEEVSSPLRVAQCRATCLQKCITRKVRKRRTRESEREREEIAGAQPVKGGLSSKAVAAIVGGSETIKYPLRVEFCDVKVNARYASLLINDAPVPTTVRF
ncbi:hypothetical protein RR46_13795 [Papilio xuthus]|uniref:Uncharacterized protein n=1 Tax=Papilio xuthus TaxID=66420 RepID=A0A194PIN4_PAPXU|nr:hypothetical protein RR46_13795 [Papilio xuthus]